MSHNLRTLSSSLLLISMLGLQACGGEAPSSENSATEKPAPALVEAEEATVEETAEQAAATAGGEGSSHS